MHHFALQQRIKSKRYNIIQSTIDSKFYFYEKLKFTVKLNNFKLFDRFNKICETKVESESEFINLCNLVQDNGLIDMKKAKEIRNYKISLRIDEQELREKLEDEVFIGNILANYLNK